MSDFLCREKLTNYTGADQLFTFFGIISFRTCSLRHMCFWIFVYLAAVGALICFFFFRDSGDPSERQGLLESVPQTGQGCFNQSVEGWQVNGNLWALRLPPNVYVHFDCHLASGPVNPWSLNPPRQWNRPRISPFSTPPSATGKEKNFLGAI